MKLRRLLCWWKGSHDYDFERRGNHVHFVRCLRCGDFQIRLVTLDRMKADFLRAKALTEKGST